MRKSAHILFGMLLLSLLCTGCSSEEEDTVRKACQSFFAAYTAADGATAGEYLSGGYAMSNFSEMQTALANKTTVEIGSAHVNDDTAQVNVKITCVDVEAVMQALPEEIDSQASAKDVLLSAFRVEDAPTREFSVSVQMIRREDNWVVCMDAALSDALLGGFQSMIENAAKELPE